MIGIAELAQMTRAVIVVTVHRGPLVEEKALYVALRDRDIAGADIAANERRLVAGEPLVNVVARA